MKIWPFNRKQQSEALPEEVQEYYESGRRQQTGKAWLLAFGTLIVTVVLAIALFFGGRWVYQQFANDDEQQPTTQEPASQDEGQNQTDEAQPQPEAPESPETDNQQGNSSTNTDNDQSSQTTPDSGSGESEIPDTGPGPGGLQ